MNVIKRDKEGKPALPLTARVALLALSTVNCNKHEIRCNECPFCCTQPNEDCISLIAYKLLNGYSRVVK